MNQTELFESIAETYQLLGQVLAKTQRHRPAGRGGGQFMPADGGGGSGGGGPKPPPVLAQPPKPRLGGSPGSRESYNDRIEGTQKEADREVKRADKAVEKASAALKVAVAKQTANKAVVKSLSTQLAGIKTKKAILVEKLAASKARIAELKKQLKKSVEKDLDKELKVMAILIESLQGITKDADAIAKKLDAI